MLNALFRALKELALQLTLEIVPSITNPIIEKLVNLLHQAADLISPLYPLISPYIPL